jgi:hypothetical protein
VTAARAGRATLKGRRRIDSFVGPRRRGRRASIFPCASGVKQRAAPREGAAPDRRLPREHDRCSFGGAVREHCSGTAWGGVGRRSGLRLPLLLGDKGEARTPCGPDAGPPVDPRFPPRSTPRRGGAARSESPPRFRRSGARRQETIRIRTSAEEPGAAACVRFLRFRSPKQRPFPLQDPDFLSKRARGRVETCAGPAKPGRDRPQADFAALISERAAARRYDQAHARWERGRRWGRRRAR